jgi:DNA-binding response OmpR family regulator
MNKDVMTTADHLRGEPAALRVLLVEDDELVALSLAALLRQQGHRVEVAATGEAGLAAASACRPHVMLVDIGLPDMSGFEVAGRLRGQGDQQGVLLVALTGWSDDESRRRSAEAGFACHLIKPVDFDGLRHILRQAGVKWARPA